MSLVECLPKFVFARDEWPACALTQAQYLLSMKLSRLFLLSDNFVFKALIGYKRLV